MLRMVKGCTVHDPSLLYEGYQRTDYGFWANVNAEKILPIVERFLTLQNDRCFLILEVPTNALDEEPPGLHKDVYYMDGLTPADAAALLHRFGELFLHDGLSVFGFGNHSGRNELLVDKYNVLRLDTENPELYQDFFEEYEIYETEGLKNAWDYFSSDTPGRCSRYEPDGKSVFDAVEELKAYGLYFAERRGS